jgi:putative peptidoglycan lipid II flippase
VLLVAVPATVALLLLAEPILITLFQYGALSPFDVSMSAWSLRAYTLGLCAFMLIKVLAPGFYARQDMVTPVSIGIRAMVANMVLNILFVVPLYLLVNLGHVGLALATSVAAYLNAGLLWRGLLRESVYRFSPAWRSYALRLSVATLSMLGVLWWLLPPVSDFLAWAWQERALWLALLCGAGGLTYVVVHIAAGTRLADLRSPSGVRSGTGSGT